jgi:DNA gyrase inhibitor GyrI
MTASITEPDTTPTERCEMDTCIARAVAICPLLNGA